MTTETIEQPAVVGAPGPSDHALLRRLDEAVRVLELRRYRRILTQGRLPFVYSAAVLLTAWMFIPLLFGSTGIIAVNGLQGRGWWAGVLFTLSGMAAGLGAYFRCQHIWNQERVNHTFLNWFLSRQDPRRAAVTTVWMAALLGLALVGIPLALAVVLAVIAWANPAFILISILLVGACALLGAAVGAMAFFIANNLARKHDWYPALGALALLATGLWMRIETVHHGWSGPWEEHPGRIATAMALITPGPALYGTLAPGFWQQFGARALGVHMPGWEAGLLYATLACVLAFYFTRVAVRGYLYLAEDPDRLEEKPRSVNEDPGQEFYWKGFKNPVWTRDVRTRLRSKETAEFIFFASVAVAAGAFVPLVMTVSDLSDPLKTAYAARQVFFWLTMTLIALITLIAPSLTADTITQERATGTLELLVGTPMRPRDILLGKLMGGVSVMLILISPSLPLFGLCYLFHGASAEQVVQVYLLVVVTVTIACLIGLTQSSINAKAGMAKFWAYAITALLVAFPGGPFWIAGMMTAPNADIRQMNAQMGGPVSAVMSVVWGFVLVLFWGNASEQLEYSEY